MKTTFLGNYVTLTILPNKNLSIQLTDNGKEFLEEKQSLEAYDSILCDLLEDIICNSTVDVISPEKIQALTSSPIIAYEVSYNENGDLETNENSVFWWFPAYMLVNPIENLLKNKETTFSNTN